MSSTGGTAASNLTAAIMAPQCDPDLNSLGTPENCVADFCLIPVELSLQLRLRVFKSNHPTDRYWGTVRVSGGCRSAALDAEEQFNVFDAFRGNDGG